MSCEQALGQECECACGKALHGARGLRAGVFVIGADRLGDPAAYQALPESDPHHILGDLERAFERALTREHRGHRPLLRVGRPAASVRLSVTDPVSGRVVTRPPLVEPAMVCPRCLEALRTHPVARVARTMWSALAPSENASPTAKAASYALQANALFAVSEIAARSLADPSMGAVTGFTLAGLRTILAASSMLALQRTMREGPDAPPERSAYRGRIGVHLSAVLNSQAFDRRIRGVPVLPGLGFAAATAAAGYFAIAGAQSAPVATALMFSLTPVITNAIKAVQVKLRGEKNIWKRGNSAQLLGGAVGVAAYSGLGQTTDPAAFVPGLLGALTWSVWPTMSETFKRKVGDRTGLRSQGIVQLGAAGFLGVGAAFEVAAGAAHLPSNLLGWGLVGLLGVGVSGYATKRMTELHRVKQERAKLAPDGTPLLDDAGAPLKEVDQVGAKWGMVNFLKPMVVGVAAATLPFLPFRVDFTAERIGGAALTVASLFAPKLLDRERAGTHRAASTAAARATV